MRRPVGAHRNGRGRAAGAALCQRTNLLGIVINKDGKPVAALVDAELFARIRRMRERVDALAGRIGQAYAELPADDGMAEIDAAVTAERQRR